ncbi:MAG: 23S rRNA (adenine(2030)-N(6))-methyltransferase RlmJ [Cellvibrionaceae bacterium]
MLSYRHSFHAGNFADVIKHIVLIEILESLRKKDKPFEYVDTHSGAGLFNLKSNDALKLEEHNTGIGKLDAKQFPELQSYFDVVDACSTSAKTSVYPGSPAIAQHYLRPQDRGWMFELHPKDFQSLSRNMKKSKKIRVTCDDGLKGLVSLLPLTSRRGLILIDPSYEVKSEYDQVIKALESAYQRFSTGIYAIWYPVVDRNTIERMEAKLIRSGIKNIQRFELGISPDSQERGMTSSGMFVINPPWKLKETLSALLPKLAQTLKQDGPLQFKCDTLVEE